VELHLGDHANGSIAADGCAEERGMLLRTGFHHPSIGEHDLQREVQLENPNVSLEQTMVAIQKAQIGFQATMHVRNRMVQAYSDIMNMQV
uniref:flagellar hook-basal body complex protein FliE n=1 Tax=Variovorax paradoxus TaxID=34073 RepID=UPI0024792353